jgi:hypothetical protein
MYRPPLSSIAEPFSNIGGDFPPGDQQAETPPWYDKPSILMQRKEKYMKENDKPALKARVNGGCLKTGDDTIIPIELVRGNAADSREVTDEELAGRHAIAEAAWIPLDSRWGTGNVGIEFRCQGRPSGIAVTTAGHCAFDLGNSWLVMPTDLVKTVARKRYRQGHIKRGEPSGSYEFVIVPITMLLRSVVSKG